MYVPLCVLHFECPPLNLSRPSPRPEVQETNAVCHMGAGCQAMMMMMMVMFSLARGRKTGYSKRPPGGRKLTKQYVHRSSTSTQRERYYIDLWYTYHPVSLQRDNTRNLAVVRISVRTPGTWD